ncbi:MAG TPA: LLM class flavin-dependent oxidoreductase, partial [Chloroflexota bacterium]
MGNPLFNENRLKLGVFGLNVSNGCAATTAEGHFETTWPNTLEVATMADEAGMEALVPVARWKGFGGTTNFNGSCFETYTWAAGLGASTRQAAVFSTSHVPTVHPIVAAKQGTTIDHISNGRFALNVVCGWFESEFMMFGAPVMEHDRLYEYAAEWLELVLRLWTEEEEFDHEGCFFKIEKGFHQPKPLHKPYPPIMNAGSSDTGARFAAKYADMVFTNLGLLLDRWAKGSIECALKLAPRLLRAPLPAS